MKKIYKSNNVILKIEWDTDSIIKDISLRVNSTEIHSKFFPTYFKDIVKVIEKYDKHIGRFK